MKCDNKIQIWVGRSSHINTLWLSVKFLRNDDGDDDDDYHHHNKRPTIIKVLSYLTFSFHGRED